MKAFLLSVAVVLSAQYCFAQHVYQIRADSVRIYNVCDTAELILENRTQDTLGFLFNKGRGRTEFRKLRLVKVGSTGIGIEGQGSLELGSIFTPIGRTLTITSGAGISVSPNTAQNLTTNRSWTITNTGVTSFNGATGAITHPAGSAVSPVLTGANVLASLVTNSAGHITSATTRTLTTADIGAAPADGGGNFIRNQTASAQSGNFWINGTAKVDGGLTVAGAYGNTVLNKDGDVETRLLRQAYAADQGTTGNFFLSQNATGAGADNYARPMSKNAVKTALGIPTGTAQSVDKVQAYSATITTAGWYRIAINGPYVNGGSGGDRADGEFTIRDYTSSLHSSTTVRASHHFSNEPTVTLLNRSSFSNNGAIKQVRLVTSVSTYGGAVVEVYVDPAGSGTSANVQFTLVDNYHGSGWTPVNWTAAPAPVGPATVLNLTGGTAAPVMAVSTDASANARFAVRRTGEVTAPGYFVNNANTQLTQGHLNALRITTSTGYLDVGSMNTDFTHFLTDRPFFYFNKQVQADNVVSIYSTNTRLHGGGLDITSGNGNGLRFWSSDYYKIWMSEAANATWGGRVHDHGSNDYNMYFKIQYENRGFVFITGDNTPKVQIDNYGLTTSNWLRVKGQAGLFFQDYGGGWYMTDATWIRSYNNKSIYQNTGILRTDGTLQVGGDGATLNVPNGGTPTINGKTIWHAGNLVPSTTAIANTIAQRDASGNLIANAFYQSSLMALKKDIRDFAEPALPLINAVAIKQFVYRNDKQENVRVGIIADSTDWHFSTQKHDRFDTNSSLAITMKAVQELSKENEALKQQNAALQSRLEALARQFEAHIKEHSSK